MNKLRNEMMRGCMHMHMENFPKLGVPFLGGPCKIVSRGDVGVPDLWKLPKRGLYGPCTYDFK